MLLTRKHAAVIRVYNSAYTGIPNEEGSNVRSFTRGGGASLLREAFRASDFKNLTLKVWVTVSTAAMIGRSMVPKPESALYFSGLQVAR